MRLFYFLILLGLLSCSDSCQKSEVDSSLPGVTSMSVDLRNKLDAKLKQMPQSYIPRTHHKDSKGVPDFSNRLLLETSPYLLQHAHNPVNWYPWGDEAFAVAAKERKPVFISIGYSTCHWCHVMEEESFEDLEIAQYLNEHYISIKVDREERPDIDDVYMSVVQLMTGRGGWPMTVLANDKGEPFFGGTYFPARDGDRGMRFGFLTLLKQMKDQYDNAPEKLAETAQKVMAALSSSSEKNYSGNLPGEAVIKTLMADFAQSFDPVHGGFGGAPKFPKATDLLFLLRQVGYSKDPALKNMITKTLDSMADGGIYDHVADGFHRYSTDSKWLVPHFEKMLYDNALLVLAYLEAYRQFGVTRYKEVAVETLAYLSREMQHKNGAFYAASDADSLGENGEREEGTYFSWPLAELKDTLNQEEFELFSEVFELSEAGNFEGRNLLHRVAQLKPGKENLLQSGLAKLKVVRDKRHAPALDTKILVSTNGLAMSAFSKAAQVLGDESYAKVAQNIAKLVTQKSPKQGRLYQHFIGDKGKGLGFLEEHAFLIAGLLDLYETTFESQWLGEAINLQEQLDQHFWDPKKNGYFMTAGYHEDLMVRQKPDYDGAIPSGNSVSARNLMRLYGFTLDKEYKEKAHQLFEYFSKRLERAPTALVEMVRALDMWHSGQIEVAIVVKNNLAEAKPFLEALSKHGNRHQVVTVKKQKTVSPGLSKKIPWLEGKTAIGGKPTAYVCEETICRLPAKSVEAFVQELKKVSKR